MAEAYMKNKIKDKKRKKLCPKFHRINKYFKIIK